jgi:GMP synthase-like glutamine amidotransferase
MKLGILDAVPRKYWATDQGITDSEKFIAMLEHVMENTVFSKFFVAEGEWPADLSDFDAYLITGSPCSANDNFPWIKQLEQFVRDCVTLQQKLAGICFGHQLIAGALGGKVERRVDGWLLGMQSFDIVDDQQWMIPPQKKCEIYHINQDHVTELPESARRIAWSEQCENSAYVIDESVLCLQGHPEQPRRAMENFFLELLDSGVDPQEIENGRARLQDEVPDADLWAQWIGHFYGF